MKKPTKKLGMILLGIWLIVTGIVQIFNISIPYIGIILGILAIITGLILLFSRQGIK
jgi:uncharacterized membrane protein